MSGLFRNKSSFNSDISSWDVSNVTNMQYMFYGANVFNQDLSGWDVTSVDDSLIQSSASFSNQYPIWSGLMVVAQREALQN